MTDRACAVFSQVIFHNYGLDLETVQKLYEKQKANCPMARNSPPVAGNIKWARQLLRRIEEPMRKFQDNKNVLTTKESKKIIRTYNKVGAARRCICVASTAL